MGTLSALAGRPSALLLAGRLCAVPARSHTGYISWEGRVGQRDDPKTRILIQKTAINLEPVKRISFQLNPWGRDAQSIRSVMFNMSSQKVRATNPKCAIRQEVLSDPAAEQIMRVELNDELGLKPVVFKMGTLTMVEALFHFNKVVLPLVKVKEEVEERSTKASKLRK